MTPKIQANVLRSSPKTGKSKFQNTLTDLSWNPVIPNGNLLSLIGVRCFGICL